MAVAFANIFMTKVETEILNQSTLNPPIWKRYIDDIYIFPLDFKQRGDNAVH